MLAAIARPVMFFGSDLDQLDGCQFIRYLFILQEVDPRGSHRLSGVNRRQTDLAAVGVLVRDALRGSARRVELHVCLRQRDSECRRLSRLSARSSARRSSSALYHRSARRLQCDGAAPYRGPDRSRTDPHRLPTRCRTPNLHHDGGGLLYRCRGHCARRRPDTAHPRPGRSPLGELPGAEIQARDFPQGA